MRPNPFDIKVVEVVLNELYGSCEVRLIELVRNVPADWTELAPLLTTPKRQQHLTS